MLSPSYLSGVAEPVIKIYAQVEQEIINDIIRRIVKTGVITETARWQIEKAAQFGSFNQEVTRLLDEAKDKSDKEVYRIMLNASTKALFYDDSIYKEAGLNPLPVSKSDTLKALILQGSNSVNMLIGKYTKTTAIDSTMALNNSLDKAYLKIISGAFSSTQAIKDSVLELAKGGISKVAYPSGATSNIESFVRRAVVTGVNQTAGKLQLTRAAEMGCTLVEVSSHPGARPEHAVWQGKVFSLTGADGKYGDFYEETGYGTGPGLCGWNCYHNFYPYFKGVSEKSFSKDPSKDAGGSNSDDYKNSQKQRYYERNIRASKREIEAIKTAIDESKDEELTEMLKSDLKYAHIKLIRKQASMREFIKETGGVRHYEREWIPSQT